MGSSPDGYLYYGYDLGGEDEWALAEYDKDEYTLKVGWYTEYVARAEKEAARLAEGMDGSEGFTIEPYTDSFRTKAEERLEQQWPDAPVEFAWIGHLEYGAGHILAIKDSRVWVSWSETELLDLVKMTWRPAQEGWNDHLKRALEILEITPVQERAGWLLACGYG